MCLLNELSEDNCNLKNMMMDLVILKYFFFINLLIKWVVGDVMFVEEFLVDWWSVMNLKEKDLVLDDFFVKLDIWCVY